MSEPFIAEIRIFAGNFAIRNWAFCDGQLLQISQNTALFSLVGTTYGGDGRSTFGLPNMQGRAPMHPGRGPGLTPRKLGEPAGTPSVTVAQSQMPNHRHSVNGTDGNAAQTPIGNSFGFNEESYTTYDGNNVGALSGNALSNTGGTQPHNNLQPLLGLNFIIALQGLYPSRS